MLAEEAKACFSPWSTCWLHSSLEFEKSHILLETSRMDEMPVEQVFHPHGLHISTTPWDLGSAQP